MENQKELVRQLHLQFLLDHVVTLEDPEELSAECRGLLDQLIPPESVTETQAEILEALHSRGPMTANPLAFAASGKPEADGQYKIYLSTLVDRGLIKSGGKGRYSKGYSITARGVAALKAHQINCQDH